jgi:hypothetical protein
MSTNLQFNDVLAALRTERDALDDRRAKIGAAIAGIESLVGVPLTLAATVATPGTGHAPDSDDVGPQENGRRQKIRALLEHDQLATREIATKLGIDRKLVKMCLQRMKKVGLLRSVGVGPGTRWTLPGSPAKEAP